MLECLFCEGSLNPPLFWEPLFDIIDAERMEIRAEKGEDMHQTAPRLEFDPVTSVSRADASAHEPLLY